MKNFNSFMWLRGYGLKRVGRILACLTLLLTLACGNVWGTDFTFSGAFDGTGNGSWNTTTSTTPIVTVDKSFSNGSKTISCVNASSKYYPTLNSATSYIKFSVPTGYRITNVNVTWMANASSQKIIALFGESLLGPTSNVVTASTKGGYVVSSALASSGSTTCDGGEDFAISSSYNAKEVMLVRMMAYDETSFPLASTNYSSFACRLGSAQKTTYTTAVGNSSSAYIGKVVLTVEPTTATKYTLAYDANGGSGSMPAHEFVSGTTVYAGQNAGFTPPTGKIFKCWNTQANGEGTEYKEGASFTLSANTTLYAQWITASTSDTYCISMYNLSTSDEMKYFTYSGYDDMQILDLEVPNYNTGGDNFWVGKGGSWKSGDLGNSGASSANERLENLCLKGNRTQKLGTGSQGVLARFFVYDNSTYNNIYIEFSPKQYSLIWGEEGKSWNPVKLYPSGCENEWTSEVVTLTSDHISNDDWKYYVGILKADDGVAYWYKSKTSIVSSMGTYNKTTDTWGGNVSTLSDGDKGFFRMWQDATDHDNWRCHFVPVYTLSYNANSGSGAPANAYVATEGDAAARTLKVSTTEPTRNGYSFEGWAESSANASAGTVDYAPGDDITLSADQELWAVWECVDPTITTDLSEDQVDYLVGASATALTVAATAAGGSVSYQWYSNDEKNTTTPTTLTTGASYTPSTAAAGTTYYYCVVTNSTAGCSTTATSSIAKIVVSRQDPTTQTFSADNTSICSGNNVTFTLEGSQVGATYYLTKANGGGSAIGDSKAGTGSALTFTATSATTGDYYCWTSQTTAFNAKKVSKSKVTISYKTATSVTVDDATLDDAVVDEEYTISGITGAGAGTLYYQWYSYSDDEGSDQTEIVGADADTYAFTPDAEGNYYFKCEVTGDCGSVKSELITVTASPGCDDPSASLSDGAYTIGGSALDLRTLWSSSNTADGVTFTVTDANGTGATIAGDGYSFSATTAGTATISASQTSTGDYCDAAETATITVSNPTYTVTYTTTGSTGGSAPTDSNSPYESGSTVTVKGNTGSLVKTGHVFLGWSDGNSDNYAPGETFTISGNTTLSPIWKEGTSATITYTMAVGTSNTWSASGSSNETTGIPNAGVTITETYAGIDDGTGHKNGSTAKLAIQTTAQGATYDSPTNYILYNFSVASGYAFTPSNITIKIANVGEKSANNIKYKAVLSDASSHSISTTYICTTQDATIETFHLYNEEGVTFDGNVSLKLWAWKISSTANGSSDSGKTGSAYRLGTPLTIAGVTESTGYAITNGSPSGGTIAITDGSSAITSSAAGETVHIEATPSMGYGFTSWSVYKTSDAETTVALDDDVDSDNKTRTFTMPAYGVTVNATFTGIVYTVTLNTNDGTINEGNVTSYRHGEGATLPTDVTRDGYRFMGWYDNSGLTGDPVEEIGTSATGDKEYWAKWAELYTITTGTHTYGSIAITNSSSAVITQAIEGETVTITATGGVHYALSEWSIYKTDDESDVTSSVSLSDDDASPATFTMPAYGVTVNASFAIESLTLAYAKGGATGDVPTSPAEGAIEYGTEITVPNKGGLAKSTDAFVGWLYNGTTLYTTGQKFTMTENVTLTAVWNTACAGGGSGEVIYKAHTKTSGLNDEKSTIDALNGSLSLTTDNCLSELSGGTLTLLTTAAEKATITKDSLIAISDKSKAYLEVSLTGGKTFQTGDIVTIGIYTKGGYLQKSSGDYSKATDFPAIKEGARYSYVVPTSLVGENTLYIKAVSNSMEFAYIDVYRPGEVLFFAEVYDAEENINLSDSETEQTTETILEAISGGKLYTKAANSTGAASYAKATNQITLQQANDNTYIKLALDEKLAEGDRIIISSTAPNYPCYITTGAKRATNIYVPYSIPAESGMINQQTLYLWKYSSNSWVRSVAIVRPSSSSECKFDVSFANENDFAGGATVTLPSDIEGVPTGKKLAQPADPTTTGDYVFGGWYDDEDCSDGHEINWNAMTITENVTIYAKWYAADYTITWMVNGETPATTKACDEVTTIVLPAAPADNTLTCADAFRGWSVTNLYGASGQAVPTDLFRTAADAPTINADKTFYAIFGDDASEPATSFTTTFTSKAWADENSKWTSGQDGSELTTGRGIQVTTTTTGANATTKEEYKAVTSVVVTYSTNASSGAGSIDIKVGGTAMIGNADVTKTGGTTDRTITYTPVSALDGKVKITVNTTTNSIFIKSVQIYHSGSFENYRCICPSLEVTPELVTAGTPIFITSSASAENKTVRSQDRLHIVGSGLQKSAALSLASPASKFVLMSSAGANLATDETGAIDAYGYIFYTPDAGDTSDGLDKNSTFTVSDGTNAEEVEQALIGRHLPADFVIAAKNGNKWYALPATMTTTTNPTPVEIAVDNINNPTIAYTASSNIYNLYGQKSTNDATGSGQLYTDNGVTVKLGMKNNDNRALFASTTGNTTISGAAVTITNNIGIAHWWTLVQTNTSVAAPEAATYTIQPSNNSIPLKAWFAAGGGPKWGLYSNGVAELRIIPASNIVFAESEVVEWGQHKAILEVDATGISATQVKAILGEDESEKIALTQTCTSVNGSATKYDYTVDFDDDIDFADAESNGAMMTLEWYNSSDVLVAVSNIIVPKIIASSATMSSLMATDDPWSKAEVHVLPGVTLTANAGDFESKDVVIDRLEIYPGATVNVTKGSQDVGTLKVRTLVLRNGWTRVGSKRYDVARLYVPTDASLAKNAVDNVWYSDWYIDYDQYYPIAVPFPVATSSICYKNTKSTATAGVRLRYYSGKLRAANVQQNQDQNWVEYTWGGTMPTNLEPSKGYIMTAKRPTGKAFSIVRMPMTFSNEWAALGEKGEVSETHKDTVYVKAWGDANTPEYAKGWNIIANPYMSLHEGELSYADASGDAIEYANIPDISFKEYDQVPIETTELKPASAFLIQAPKDGTVTFESTARVVPAPSYRKEEAPKPSKQKAYIVLGNEEANDMMGLIISDRYTAEYEINADLEKLLSGGTSLKTYMHYGERNMAYVAINQLLAQEWIPVSVRLPQTGEYTFSLHEASKVSELEGLYLIDYTSNEITNLIEDSYMFVAEAGTISNRFAINATIGERQTPTEIDVVGANKNGDGPIKFLYRDKVFIWHRGMIYDATGKKVGEINK